ncbi:NAD(+) diphosphatase [Defluviimonas sp. WL0050]|uniref:NAD(+) diphosphatase n=1 Tax=Albidovulum litorale TaxID=2984134 RepID=A0ABT2ZM72_9RHOB|nr:NAD(+) diphosphatase [Defluviimonas sp. WL0050]MCV2872198.1 NAD(+) diphosphatase [Defluviimonas sp. WL0050]
MRKAETVTFGGSGLDRAAWLRGKAEDLSAHMTDGSACILPIWRGKPLFASHAAAWVARGHPVLETAAETPVFLGLDEGQARFAADISAWEPETGDTPPAGVFFDPTEQRHPALPDDYRFAELRGVMADLTPRDAELVATAKAILGWHRSHRFCSACGQPSAVADGGWQRRCATCGTFHFPRTDPVVIMLITRGNKTLLGRSPGWPEGMYSCLAGFVEPGESLEAAVRREVAEETGVRVGPVRYLASQPWPYPSSLMIGCTGEAVTDEITVDPHEIEDAIWVSREDVALALSGEHPTIRRPRNGAIAGFLLANWVADRLD